VTIPYFDTLMKKIVFCLSMGTLLFSASCKKDLGGLTENTWSASGKIFTASTINVSAASNYISGADGKGSSIDFVFKSLPSANSDFTVNSIAYTNSDAVVRLVLSGGATVYNSVDNTAGRVSVRVMNGKYTVITNNIKLVNASSATDTVIVSTNLVQQ
jgi:hypothetical protein